MRFASALAVSSSVLLCMLAGCHVSSHNNGKNDNVDIGTPFGSMQVKTNDSAAAAGLGITPYPGAHLVKDKDDDGAADVNMSFGSFHLGVKAASYSTSDSEDKVLAFYRQDLAHYGAVLQCKGSTPVGEPKRTAEGLTCDYDQHNSGHVSWNTDVGKDNELRTGSKQHQHIVSVETKDGQTKIGLVALDLPSGLSTHNDKDSD